MRRVGGGGSGHVTGELAGYALGCVEPAAQRRIEAHLAGCAACRARLERERATVDLLALAAPCVEPPAGLGRRVLASVRAPGRAVPRGTAVSLLRSPRFLAVAAAACFVAAVGLAAANLALSRDLRSLAARALPEAPVVVLLSGTPTAPAASAVLIVGADARRGTLAVKGLAALGADRQYQLWLIRDGARTSGGVFSVDAAGDGTLHVAAPRPLDDYPSFGVTVEPAGGSPGPTGSKVLGGTL